MKIGFFKRIGISCGGFKQYYNLVKSGGAIQYFIVFSILLGLIAGLISGGLAFSPLKNGINSVFNDCPKFVLSDGILKVEGDMPQTFESDDSYVIIDTSGKSNSGYSNTRNKHTYFISQTSIMEYNKNGFSRELVNFNNLKNYTLTEKDFISFRNMLGNSVPILAFFVMILIKLLSVPLAMLFSALVLSLLTLIINAAIRFKMKYSDVLATTIYAITLPTIIYEAIYMFTGEKWRFLFYALSAVFIFTALFTMRRTSRMLRESQEVYSQAPVSDPDALEADINHDDTD